MKIESFPGPGFSAKAQGYLGGGVTPERHVSIMQQVGSRLGQPYAFGFVNNREVNPRLRGWIKYRTFKNMMTNSHIVNTGVTLYLDMVMKSKLSFLPAIPEGEEGDEDAKMYADMAEQILKEDPKTPLRKIMARIAMFRFNGYSVQNWWARRREDGVITVADVSERIPETIEEITSDDHGEVQQFVQRLHTGQYGVIPIMNAVYLVDDSLHTEPEGTGLCRSLFPYWEQVESFRNLEGIGYEKDMRGIIKGSFDIEGAIEEAIEKLDEGATDAQIADFVAAKTKDLADFVFGKRKQSRTGVIVDSSVHEGVATDGTNRPINARKQDVELLENEESSFSDLEITIKRIEREMATVMGIQQVMLGDGKTGSWALAKEQADEFGLRVGSSIDAVAEALREQILKRIFMLNGWPLEMLPTVTAELPNYVTADEKAGVLTKLNGMDTRDPAVDDIRAQAGLPPVPEEIKESNEEMREMEMEQMANPPEDPMRKGRKKKKPAEKDSKQKDLL